MKFKSNAQRKAIMAKFAKLRNQLQTTQNQYLNSKIGLKSYNNKQKKIGKKFTRLMHDSADKLKEVKVKKDLFHSLRYRKVTKVDDKYVYVYPSTKIKREKFPKDVKKGDVLETRIGVRHIDPKGQLGFFGGVATIARIPIPLLQKEKISVIQKRKGKINEKEVQVR